MIRSNFPLLTFCNFSWVCTPDDPTLGCKGGVVRGSYWLLATDVKGRFTTQHKLHYTWRNNTSSMEEISTNGSIY